MREGLEAWRGDVESPFEVLEDLARSTSAVPGD
jgi:hypothetical protein